MRTKADDRWRDREKHFFENINYQLQKHSLTDVVGRSQAQLQLQHALDTNLEVMGQTIGAPSRYE